MALINRTCHNCGMDVEIPSAAPGTVFHCPSCDAEIVAGIRSARPGGAPSPYRPARSAAERRQAAKSLLTAVIIVAILCVAVLAAVLFALSG